MDRFTEVWDKIVAIFRQIIETIMGLFNKGNEDE